MSFSSYLIKKFDHKHENIFFRDFSKKLTAHFGNSEGEHVLIGNLSCNGHLLDAVFIKKGSICVIDFKDYSGELTFSENGPWWIKTNRGELVAVAGGGRFLSPFHQVIAYRHGLINFLSSKKDQILEPNHTNLKWNFTSSIVLFQRTVEFDPKELDNRFSRIFYISDSDKIISLLEDLETSDLNLTDEEIRRILEVLGISPAMRLEKIDWETLVVPEPKGRKGEGLALLMKLVKPQKDQTEYQKIITFFKTLVNLERYKEPDVDNLSDYDFDSSKDLSGYIIDLSQNRNFHAAMLENLGKQWPKDIFIGVGISIAGIKYPLLHAMAMNTEVTEKRFLKFNLNEFETHLKTLERLNLPEDYIEELSSAVARSKTLQEKIDQIRKLISVPIELTNTISLGLSEGNNFTTQLMAELTALEKRTVIPTPGSVFEALVLKKAITSGSKGRIPEPFMEIKALNDSQSKASEVAFTQPLTIITGPPGTGKTQVIMNLVANAICSGKSILVASKNNRAIENVIERLSAFLPENYFLRFGSKKEINEGLKPVLDRLISQVATNKENLEDPVSAKANLYVLGSERRILSQELVKITKLEIEIKEWTEKLKDLKTEKENWINTLSPIEKDFFVARSISIKLDPNVYGKTANILNNALKGRFAWLMFHLLQRRKTERAIIEMNRMQGDEIYEYISTVAPAIDPKYNIAESLKRNLEFIWKLRVRGPEVVERKNKFDSQLRSIEDTRSKIESDLAHLKIREPQIRERLAQIKKIYPEVSARWLKSYCQLKMSAFNVPACVQFKEFLPAGNPYNQEREKAFVASSKDFLRDFHAVAITSLSIRNAFPLAPEIFDFVVFDEASQCDVASALPLIYRSKQVVVIGDPLQLPHITKVKIEEEKYLLEMLGIKTQNIHFVEESLFDYCRVVSDLSRLEKYYLQEHYRCHPEIIKFSSIHFYGPKLGLTLSIKTRDEQFQIEQKGIWWENVTGEMNSGKNINHHQLTESIKIARHYANKYPEASIGIITPFRDQVKKIEENLTADEIKKFSPNTVHKYQGDEKDIIIYCLVVASHSQTGKANWINRNFQLINVALTRAKCTLVIVGDFNYCVSFDVQNGREGKAPLRELAEYVDSLGKVKSKFQ